MCEEVKCFMAVVKHSSVFPAAPPGLSNHYRLFVRTLRCLVTQLWKENEMFLGVAKRRGHW
jgi:hypothetical protein